MSYALSILGVVFLVAGETEAPLRNLTLASGYQFTLRESTPGPELLGRFQKDRPLAFRADGIDFFKKGDVIAYKQGDRWERSRTGTLSDPLRVLGAVAKVRSARLPHEELSLLEKVWTGVKKTEAKGVTLLTGELNEKAAKALARTENHSVAQSGKAQVWVDAKGQVSKYQIDIRLQGRLGDAEVDGMATRTITLSDIGGVTIEVPAEARKALGE